MMFTESTHFQVYGAYIFSSCTYIQQVGRSVFSFLGVRFVPSQWHILIPWFNGLKQNSLRTKLLTSALTMLWYEVWKARNHSIFRREKIREEEASKGILWNLRMKIGAVDSMKINPDDRRWLDTLVF